MGFASNVMIHAIHAKVHPPTAPLVVAGTTMCLEHAWTNAPMVQWWWAVHAGVIVLVVHATAYLPTAPAVPVLPISCTVVNA